MSFSGSSSEHGPLTEKKKKHFTSSDKGNRKINTSFKLNSYAIN